MLSLIIFLASFVSLSFWFLFKDNEEIRGVLGKLFLGSFGLYLGTALLIPGVVSWSTLAMNIGFLFGAGFFLNTFSSSKIIFIPMLILMTVGYYCGVRGIDWFPFANTASTSKTIPTSSNIEGLDPDNELLVEVSNGHQLSELQTIINKYKLKLEPAFALKDGASTDLDDYYAVNIPTEQTKNYAAIVADFKASNLIDHIEANEVLSLDPAETVSKNTPTRKKKKYTANDPDLGKVWGHDAMEVEALYELLATEKVKPKKKAKIAIIDTGVDYKHEDLSANFVSIASEHNSDPHGHGTHCAGIAAAVSNNGIGIASFSPTSDFVEVTSVKVFGKYGNTTQRTIINGMLLAADNGADVLSMSLGGPSTAQSQRAYKQAVQYANKKGGIVVVAAGNENIDARKRAPASVDGVITVAALAPDLDKAVFSNDVSGLRMGIAAPGVDIYSTIPGNKYEYFNGTSMATPYVAGLLGLMKSIQPDLTTEQAYKILKQTGGETRNTKVTGELIHPANAVKSLLKK
jgi:thermitase